MDDRVTFELLQAARAYRVRSAKLLARVGLYPGQDALLKLLDRARPNDDGRGRVGAVDPAADRDQDGQPPFGGRPGAHRGDGQGPAQDLHQHDRRRRRRRSTRSTRSGASWRREALDQVEPQQLRTQLSAIARNLSKNEDKASQPRLSSSASRTGQGRPIAPTAGCGESEAKIRRRSGTSRHLAG